MLSKTIEYFVNDHVTNEEVRRKIQAAFGEYDHGQETEINVLFDQGLLT